jgi:hypothetical protein
MLDLRRNSVLDPVAQGVLIEPKPFGQFGHGPEVSRVSRALQGARVSGTRRWSGSTEPRRTPCDDVS